jgi:hypothetical protein
MTKRINRADSTEDLISLCECGVRDLRFDSVEIISHDRVVGQWVCKCKVHPDSNRTAEIRRFRHNGVAIRWTMPSHDSDTYQHCLSETWHHFLNEMEAKHLVLSAGKDDSFDHMTHQHQIKWAG